MHQNNFIMFIFKWMLYQKKDLHCQKADIIDALGFSFFLQDCYPVRTKSLDFVNAPPYVNVVLNIFRRFMTEKLRQRVSIKCQQHVF